MPPTQWQSTTPEGKVEYCLQRYGDIHKFLAVFSPKNILRYTQDAQQCCEYRSNAPTLNTMLRAYGRTAVIQWIMTLLVDLSEYACLQNGIDPNRLEEIAIYIYDENYHLRASELMLFFSYVKRGKFGRIGYSTFDPITFMMMFPKFYVLRNQLIDMNIREIEEEKERIAKSQPTKDRREDIKNLIARLGFGDSKHKK